MALNIKPEELRSNASSMKNKIEIMRSSLQTASNVISTTSTSFQGTGADAIRNKYHSLEGKFNDFYNAMTNYATFLETVANRYEEENANIAKKAEELLTSDYNS